MPCKGDQTVGTPNAARMAASARGRRLWAALLAGAVLAAVAVLSVTGSRLAGAPAVHLGIAVSATAHAALLHLAATEGYFADEGLDVTLQTVSHGKAALDLLIQGKADMAAAAETPFVISVLKGAPLGMAANLVRGTNVRAMVARRDRDIKAPADLVHRRIGVPQGTSGEYFLWAFCIRNKLRPESVTLVDMPPGQLADALAGGTVDAVSAWHPVRDQAERLLGANAMLLTATDA